MMIKASRFTRQNPIRMIGMAPQPAEENYLMAFTTISYVVMGRKVCPEREASRCYVEVITLKIQFLAIGIAFARGARVVKNLSKLTCRVTETNDC